MPMISEVQSLPQTDLDLDVDLIRHTGREAASEAEAMERLLDAIEDDGPAVLAAIGRGRVAVEDWMLAWSAWDTCPSRDNAAAYRDAAKGLAGALAHLLNRLVGVAVFRGQPPTTDEDDDGEPDRVIAAEAAVEWPDAAEPEHEAEGFPPERTDP